MPFVGIRELKNRLTYHLRLIKQGKEVVVTDRGTPVAVLKPIEGLEKHPGLEERLAFYAEQGLITLPRGKFDFTTPPLSLKGRPLSQTVLEDRG
ncbi:MAG: hypothetical protein C3F12_07700 [Candidatus Methylomirabilota bacterium]|nr:type II toxin-antitoxin system prevent-host-death family antitoxin [Candidatus Methylomirabilis sp.]NJD68999.1 type II toxin-antitoxin system Phd/YefM family antitoxin [candidate division NC10 bacterium]PWB45945.1 MAG: hypothetical protein C3F12_07700 [candidate division NC10 bacterium]